MRVDVTLPIKLESTLNKREHHMARARRVKAERGLVDAVVRTAAPRGMAGILGRSPCATAKVTITRIAPRALDDDNATASAKACRDAVAAFLGLDDRDARIGWTVDQKKPLTPKTYGVRVVVEVESP